MISLLINQINKHIFIFFELLTFFSKSLLLLGFIDFKNSGTKFFLYLQTNKRIHFIFYFISFSTCSIITSFKFILFSQKSFKSVYCRYKCLFKLFFHIFF